VLGPLERANLNHCYSLLFRIPDDGQSLKPTNSDDYNVFQISSISDFSVYKTGELRDFDPKASGNLFVGFFFCHVH
jgi:hypothetical protein